MKKVLFVINAMGRAGAEQALIALLKSLASDDIELSFLSIIDRGEMFSALPKNVVLRNPNPSSLPMFGRGVRLFLAKKVVSAFLRHGFSYLPKGLFLLRRQLRRRAIFPDKLFWPLLAEAAPYDGTEYDLAVAYIEGAATYYVAERVKAKKKLAFVHVSHMKAGYERDFDLPYYKKFDRVCCVSQALLDECREVFPELSDKLCLSHNIIDFEGIAASAHQGKGFQDDFDGIRIVTTARLVEQKNIALAVSAFALFANDYNVRWYVLGEGEERGRLERQIKRLGVEGRFVLLGRVENPYPFVAQCDIYVQPSRFEGMCIALLEALALGRPCVITDFGGAAAQLTDGKDALIVPERDDALAHAIVRLVESPELRCALQERAAEAIISGTNKQVLSML